MIQVTRKISAKNPVLIAAWPGMGYVALNAANYLKDQLKPETFARYRSDRVFFQRDIEVSGGLIRLPKIPDGQFYHWKNPAGRHDVIFFISTQQPPMEKGLIYARSIVDFIATFNIHTVYTFAALLTSMDYLQRPKVWLTATDKDLLHQLKGKKTKILRSGHVSGLNGLFLGAAKQRHIRGACLLGEIPFYMTQIENPRASMAVLEKISSILGITLDYRELIAADQTLIEEIEKLIEQVRDPSKELPSEQPISDEDMAVFRKMLSAQCRLPNSAREEIEELFHRAKDDLSQAHSLKKKLDEWHAYRDYEDRFLSLFKKHNEENN